MHVLQVCRDNYLVFIQSLGIFTNDINAFIIWCVISVSFLRRLSVRSGDFVYHLFSIEYVIKGTETIRKIILH